MSELETGGEGLELVRKLGSGSFGAAYLVRDTHDDDEMRHPNILQYFDRFVEGDMLCLLTEYCDGGDLSQRLALLKQEQRVLTESEEKATTFAGTPFNMSPEALQGIGYNFKSDMWSVGCLLYEMATLEPAFSGTGLLALLYQICENETPSLPDRYSASLQNIQTSLWSRDPEKRPSAAQVLRDPLLREHSAVMQCELDGQGSQLQRDRRAIQALGHQTHSRRRHRTPSAHNQRRASANDTVPAGVQVQDVRVEGTQNRWGTGDDTLTSSAMDSTARSDGDDMALAMQAWLQTTVKGSVHAAPPQADAVKNHAASGSLTPRPAADRLESSQAARTMRDANHKIYEKQRASMHKSSVDVFLRSRDQRAACPASAAEERPSSPYMPSICSPEAETRHRKLSSSLRSNDGLPTSRDEGSKSSSSDIRGSTHRPLSGDLLSLHQGMAELMSTPTERQAAQRRGSGRAAPLGSGRSPVRDQLSAHRRPPSGAHASHIPVPQVNLGLSLPPGVGTKQRGSTLLSEDSVDDEASTCNDTLRHQRSKSEDSRVLDLLQNDDSVRITLRSMAGQSRRARPSAQGFDAINAPSPNPSLSSTGSRSRGDSATSVRERERAGSLSWMRQEQSYLNDSFESYEESDGEESGRGTMQDTIELRNLRAELDALSRSPETDTGPRGVCFLCMLARPTGVRAGLLHSKLGYHGFDVDIADG
ncbi:uncharacterized protein MONBRDRAFT_8573 [Monosiga brevicollis MX1]|uniref:non-specific serine/threonine protein kinase n=1 Tax=Monosiga brevicollis TaxID=81824 RepID=A9V0F9_MONBE|nr:uncharacterized protein MONBRDRAFT_8573 [Monosiga brevicollis MX1]EDQ89004.1 predicted protein [Monosiga brevicollis MX1]|eukprot:XP_001746109.1 hypothetical protein [Monosiga brevicollis MX1]